MKRGIFERAGRSFLAEGRAGRGWECEGHEGRLCVLRGGCVCVGTGLALMKKAIGVEILLCKMWMFAMVSCLRLCLMRGCPIPLQWQKRCKKCQTRHVCVGIYDRCLCLYSSCYIFTWCTLYTTLLTPGVQVTKNNLKLELPGIP